MHWRAVGELSHKSTEKVSVFPWPCAGLLKRAGCSEMSPPFGWSVWLHFAFLAVALVSAWVMVQPFRCCQQNESISSQICQ